MALREPTQAYIAKRVEIDDAGCWNWKLAISTQGYGLCFRRDWRGLAHRFTYDRLVGSIPEGLQLDHLCRNTACVNPDHLEPVTASENLRRANDAREGRKYTVYQQSNGLWCAAADIRPTRDQPERRRKVIRSKRREVAIERMDAWLAQA